MSEQPSGVDLADIAAKLDRVIGLLEEIRDTGNSVVGLLVLAD